MPVQPPRFRPAGYRPPKAWERPGRNAHRRKRGRAGVEERRRILAEEPLCRRCLEVGRTSASEQVDHIVPLSQGGSDERENKQGLCIPCHRAKTLVEGSARRGAEEFGGWYVLARPIGLRPSLIPLTMVCGPPGSGKTTYARTHAGPKDLIVDLDEIRCRLAGVPIHRAGDEWQAQALVERNRILTALTSNRTHQRAWFIIGAPTEEERQWWRAQLGAEQIVVMNVSKAECLRRIANDPLRRGVESQMAQWVERWFQRAAIG